MVWECLRRRVVRSDLIRRLPDPGRPAKLHFAAALLRMQLTLIALGIPVVFGTVRPAQRQVAHPPAVGIQPLDLPACTREIPPRLPCVRG
jgi:hypothetical protein